MTEESETQLRNRNVGDAANNEVAQQEGENAPVDQANQQQQPKQSTWGVIMGTLQRMFFMWMIMNFFRGGNKTDPNKASEAKIVGRNIFSFGEKMSMYVFVNELEDFNGDFPKQDLFWKLDNIEFGSWEGGANNDGLHSHKGKFPASKHVQNNGSIYLHAFFTKMGYAPFESYDGNMRYNEKKTAYKSRPLNKMMKRMLKKTKNLLTGESEISEKLLEDFEKSNNEILSHWHPNLTINIMNDQTPMQQAALPEVMKNIYTFDETGQFYQPVINLCSYWNYNRDYMPLNETVEELELNLEFQPLSLWKMQMFMMQEQGYKSHPMYSWMSDDLIPEQSLYEQDQQKEMMLESNPYLLGVTVVASLAHCVLEFFAFKNDIQFWNSRDSLAGLSVRSILFNAFTSVIVLLYCLDNETSNIIIGSSAIGLLIELWKITKVLNIKVDRTNKYFGVIPRLIFEDKSSYKDSETKAHDRAAFKYMSWALYPCLVGYFIYSLMYNEHKGIYSFILEVFYSFILMFGFIMMTPQLYINYKLQSVAHLPWRMLTYKAVNTFIDDMFAFCIKMPTLHRIGCFRDDIIFFIYLYQRYKYRTDYTRANEYGIRGDGQRVVEGGEQLPVESEPKVVKDGVLMLEKNVEENKEKTAEEKKKD